MAWAINEAQVPHEVHLSFARGAFRLPLLCATEGFVASGSGAAVTAVDLGICVAKLDGHVSFLLFAVNSCFYTRNLSHEGAFSVSNMADHANVDGRLKCLDLLHIDIVRFRRFRKRRDGI